jgi:hypothetical protein
MITSNIVLKRESIEVSILEISGITYFSVMRGTVLENKLKTQETKYALVYGTIFVNFLSSFSNGDIFS